MSTTPRQTKLVSSIPDDLIGISKSLFTVLDRVRNEGWTSLDAYLTDHVFVPLDDDIQRHLEDNARDRMQGTVKQRKQGHKKPLLPFVQPSEYDIRNFSPEYKEEIDKQILPNILATCLQDMRDRISKMLELLLRSEAEIANEKGEWGNGSSFEELYAAHVSLKNLTDEYSNKEKLIAGVNARTQLILEYITYFKDQVLPFARQGVFSHDNFCPPPAVYRQYCNTHLEQVNNSLRDLIRAWEGGTAKAPKQLYVAKGERYMDTMLKDVWEGTEPISSKQEKPRAASTATPAASGAAAAARGVAGRTPVPKPAPSPAGTKSRSTSVAASPIKPVVLFNKLPSTRSSSEDTGVDDDSGIPAQKTPEAILVMDRPASHIRPPKDVNVFDPSNREGGRRVTIIDSPLEDDGTRTFADEPYIRVACRIRPLMAHEEGNDAAVSAFDDGETVEISKGGKTAGTSFKLHYTAGSNTTQVDFYNTCHVVPLLEKSLDGHYVTVFAYGQTGSGKTHTIAGPESVIGLHEGVRITDPENKVPESVKKILKAVLKDQLLQHGIMPRGARHLFDRIVEIEKNEKNVQFDVRCSYVEIYNENLYDLLSGDVAPLEVKLNTGDREGFYVAGLVEKEARTTDDVMRIFMTGANNRSVSSHALNKQSSRSHALFSMIVDKKTWVPEDNALWIHRGKVTLVDLAGSESVKSTKTAGAGLLETQGINTSLLHLSNIVSSLAKDGLSETTHIPWRNSKLTMLLMESLANNGTTLMIANVSPSGQFLSETTNTLTFATKAANITGKKVKKATSDETELETLRRDVVKYKRQCDALATQKYELETRVQLLEEENRILSQRLKDAGL
eukprot:c9020_g3_i1.p1 GENE.c9020_g3_i1~~c9020_g3_i1.p1  ORF type:complete len:845 (-),score=237.37 c9020_g3_i1:233-2767(-)